MLKISNSLNNYSYYSLQHRDLRRRGRIELVCQLELRVIIADDEGFPSYHLVELSRKGLQS